LKSKRIHGKTVGFWKLTPRNCEIISKKLKIAVREDMRRIKAVLKIYL